MQHQEHRHSHPAEHGSGCLVRVLVPKRQYAQPSEGHRHLLPARLVDPAIAAIPSPNELQRLSVPVRGWPLRQHEPRETEYTCSGECNGGGEYCPTGTAQPLPCPAGTYLPVGVAGLAEASCIPCAPGAYNPDEGGTHCLTCPAGKLSESVRSAECSNCPSGGFCSAEGAASLRQTFTPCPAGTFNADGGQTSSASCQACRPGQANPIPGSSDPADCRDCSAGTYQPVAGKAECDKCAAGKYQPFLGGSECIVCGAGNYSSNVLSCEPCQVGEYCPAGSVVGTPCPLRYTTEGRGAERLDDCGCPAKTFDDEISCEPCVADLMKCTRTGLTLATVPLPPSRWRLSV